MGKLVLTLIAKMILAVIAVGLRHFEFSRPIFFFFLFFFKVSWIFIP